MKRLLPQSIALSAIVLFCSQCTPTHSWWNARTAGDVSAAIRALEVGGNIEYRDKYGFTPLMWAANIGTPEMVKALISAGANVKARTKYGLTALMLAAA